MLQIPLTPVRPEAAKARRATAATDATGPRICPLPERTAPLPSRSPSALQRKAMRPHESSLPKSAVKAPGVKHFSREIFYPARSTVPQRNDRLLRAARVLRATKVPSSRASAPEQRKGHEQRHRAVPARLAQTAAPPAERGSAGDSGVVSLGDVAGRSSSTLPKQSCPTPEARGHPGKPVPRRGG